MTESERQIVSSLSSLAAGMAGGLVAGDSAGAVAGAGAGKTAVENNYLGTGVNILGYQIGADQKKAFGEELQAACSGGQSQGCTDTYNKWKEKSYQQGGLENTEEREAWESLVQAAYAENVIPLCKGDLFCAMNVNARMNLDMVLYAGDAVGLKDSVEVATRATNIANDNWARLSLQAVGDITLLMTLGSMVGPLASGAKATGGAAGKVDDLATSGLSSASNLPSGTGLGGFKVGLSADDITAINSQFGGSVSFREVDTAIANAANYDGFYNKAGSMIRDIAGGHLFDNGNKRTAVEVVEQLIIKNGVDGPPKQIIWNVVDKVATGKLTNVQDISKALRGLD
ncbi:VENN motif pre-toxin domain-containing protein [Pseudomonas mohnii]|uniref:VENN motif pre-toxin domain-containing protein n=1 Tax=Pseudomonas mohnii TaxID=395600 RepID=UPI0018DC841C|nr:VENN motif pre-toxin domain-containing protein [Pseudomonas mohnii]MBH8610721.1 VENN motif pre-toxin domain-containing protein [Pseudomonas mohnii]